MEKKKEEDAKKYREDPPLLINNIAACTYAQSCYLWSLCDLNRSQYKPILISQVDQKKIWKPL